MKLPKIPSLVTPVDKYRVVYGNGYVVDKRIFWGYLFIILCMVLFIFNLEGWNFEPKVYAKCNLSVACDNPLYGQCEDSICSMRTLPPYSEYGNKIPAYYNTFILIVIALGITAVLLNHYFNNKNFVFVEVE